MFAPKTEPRQATSIAFLCNGRNPADATELSLFPPRLSGCIATPRPTPFHLPEALCKGRTGMHLSRSLPLDGLIIAVSQAIVKP